MSTWLPALTCSVAALAIGVYLYDVALDSDVVVMLHDASRFRERDVIRFGDRTFVVVLSSPGYLLVRPARWWHKVRARWRMVVEAVR